MIMRRSPLQLLRGNLRPRRLSSSPPSAISAGIAEARCDGRKPLLPTSVYSFGDNSQGALGLPSPPYEAFEPTRVLSIPSDVSNVAAGHYHSLAVTSSGDVWAWGRNDEGQLGRGMSCQRRSWCEPQRVDGLEGVLVRAAFASGVVSAAVGDDGSLWMWGKSKRGQLGLGNGVTEAIKPSKVEALEGKHIVKVSFGWGHVVAQTSNGELFGWGLSADARLGQMGEVLEAKHPLTDKATSSCDAGNLSSILQTIDKELIEELQKEMKMPIIWEPQIFKDLNHVKVSDVACGLDHTLVLCCDGTLLSAGDNTYGQLGRTKGGSNFLPVDTSLHFHPQTLSAGLGHSLAVCNTPPAEELEAARGLVSWGWNWASQLGRKGQPEVPAIIECLKGKGLLSASGGRAHSIALTSEGKVWTWGSGKNGRLGLGSSGDEEEPSLIECLNGMVVLQAVAGFDHNLLLVGE